MNKELFIENITKLLSGDIQEFIIPCTPLSLIDDILVEEFNKGERIEFHSSTNGWDIDWWFNFPLTEGYCEGKTISVAGSVYNTRTNSDRTLDDSGSLKVYVQNTEDCYRED